MRQKAILEANGYNHITTRVNTFTGCKEHLFYNKKHNDEIIIREEVQ